MDHAVGSLILEAWADLKTPGVAWQIGIVIVALLISRIVIRLAHLDRIEASGVWRFGVGGLRRILGPAVALAVVVIAGEILGRHM